MVAFRFALAAALAVAVAAAAGTPCARLTDLAIPDVKIESAATAAATPQTPESCRVRAVARPTADSEIHIEVWLPGVSAWNGKFLGTGNGGYSSALSYPAMENALQKGYATAGHDTGHTGQNLRFGLGHPEKVRDYAWRAVHTMTVVAKLLVRVHLGRHADHSYFSSCSAGGHQAMSEVQRFPEDYDGVIAGAPANNRIRQTFGFLWMWRAMHDETTGAPLVTLDELKLVNRAVVAACDANDGVRDGLIGDPRRCAFDPAQLACSSVRQAQRECLTEQQVTAFRKIYAGAKNPLTGDQIFAGLSKGSEALGNDASQSWRAYLLDPPRPMRSEALGYFLFHDPNWDWRTVDIERDLAFADREISFMDATAKDLSSFSRRGGKLILYAGWADPVVPPMDTIRYYESVARTMGGLAKTQEFARLFVAPGMGHCSGGPGPNQFDALGALDRWVTTGEAPARLIATHESEGKVDRSRPLCPHPQGARYKGAGSTDEAANFTCAAPAP